MNDIGSLGVILLLALLAGHIVKWLRIPEVTGYLLAGVALGPSILGWVTADNVSALHALSEVALGLILFSIGTVFEFEHFRRVGRQLATITLWSPPRSRRSSRRVYSLRGSRGPSPSSSEG